MTMHHVHVHRHFLEQLFLLSVTSRAEVAHLRLTLDKHLGQVVVELQHSVNNNNNNNNNNNTTIYEAP